MQDKAQKAAKTAAAPPLGRSSVAKLPAELREAVNRAVAKGATVDDIAALIRAEGESGSRSAAGRDAKDMRGLVRTRHEADRIVRSWMQAHGERPQDEMALVLIQSLRAMALATMERMTEREEPVSMEELARFSVVVKRIESTDELRRRREQAAQKAAAKAAEAAKPKPRRGISPETEAYIRSKVQGEPYPPRRPVTSVPIDPWAPDEPHAAPPDPADSGAVPPDPADSGAVPPDPAEEAWTRIAPGVIRTSSTSILSLGPEDGADGRAEGTAASPKPRP